MYCWIGRSAIFGVILAFITPFFISLLLQVRVGLGHIYGPQIRVVYRVLINGVINGRIRLNDNYPPRHTPMSPMLRIGCVRDAGKKGERREYADN
jgi:hypothetical protein